MLAAASARAGASLVPCPAGVGLDCGAHGDCFTDGVTPQCICDEGYAGGQCTYQAVMDCTASGSAAGWVTTAPAGSTNNVTVTATPCIRCNQNTWCANGATCQVTPGQILCACTANFFASIGAHCLQPRVAAAPPPAPPGSASPTWTVPQWIAAPIVVGASMFLCLCCFVGVVIRYERKGQPVFRPLARKPGTRTLWVAAPPTRAAAACGPWARPPLPRAPPAAGERPHAGGGAARDRQHAARRRAGDQVQRQLPSRVARAGRRCGGHRSLRLRCSRKLPTLTGAADLRAESDTQEPEHFNECGGRSP